MLPDEEIKNQNEFENQSEFENQDELDNQYMLDNQDILENQESTDHQEEDILDESEEIADDSSEEQNEESIETDIETPESNDLTKKTKIKFLILLITMFVTSLVYVVCKIFDPLKHVYDSDIKTSNIVNITKYIMIVTAVVLVVGIVLLILYLVKVLKFNNEKILSKINDVLDWFVIFPICIMIVSICFSFIFTFTVVDGNSMEPNLVNGEELLLNYHTKIERFDIVVIEVSPYYNTVLDNTLYVKRIIGMPGDNIRYDTHNVGGVTKSTLYINGEIVKEEFYNDTKLNYGVTNNFFFEKICEMNGLELVKNDSNQIVIPEGYYLVLGDNRLVSKDSRMIGLIREQDILGTINYKMNSIFSYEKIE